MGYCRLAGFLRHIPELKTFPDLASTYFLVMSPVTHIGLVELHCSFVLGPSPQLPPHPVFDPDTQGDDFSFSDAPGKKSPSSLTPGSQASSPVILSYLRVLFPPLTICSTLSETLP